MKTATLFTLSLLCFVFAANAQNQAVNSSKNCRVGKMLDAPEKTIEKKIVKIKKVRSLLFEAITVTNANAGITESGLRISGTTGRNYAPLMSAYIDAVELDEFIQALDKMMVNTIDVEAPQNNVEYKYQSHSGFWVKAYNEKKLLSKTKAWHVNVKLVEGLPQSEYLFDTDDLIDFKSAAEQAKSLLNYQVVTATK
ncbi:hypothetical protein EOD41_13815 [Mucilaginibacter limnophilus]|uniref:Uncharacterized protein n=1 Tax=Mucilaginibacter limnophilus TaxID=1932778 RepID=A0A3S3TFQ2_9SPHI|nr:hypothetical protein [Mucilaginibacter limnophilus]RVU00036.1 hypothetical protein EOD41_13815 [Mucilaginibacter limnophilus]